MVQLTQSNQLGQIPGSAGSVQTIVDNTPTAGEAVSGALKSGLQMYDTAGTIYAKNQAEPMAKQAISDIESAAGIAERLESEEDFIAPEELPVSDAEFTMIQNAVRSGGMSQSKARLIASSRLRTRIAEQPFFADKLRQAASEVVGFNIESEPVKQYFAAFQTEAEMAAGSKNKYMQDKLDQAAAIAPVMGVTTEEVYKDLILRDELKARKEAALARRDLNGATDTETFTAMNQANSETRFTNILGTFKEQFGATGSVDEVAANVILAEAEANEIRELEQTWRGDQTSTEFGRARDTIAASYDQIREYAEAVGFDNLNKINIQRAKDARTMLGDRLYSTEKLVAENLGQQVASQAFDTLANVTEPSRLEAMFRSNPTLGKVGALIGNPTAQKAFGGQIADVYESIANRQEVRGGVNSETGVDNSALTDSILSDMFNSGEEGEEASVEYLQELGKDTKAISLIATKAPGRASQGSKEYFKAQYTNALPQITERFASVVAANPDLEWEIGADGQISLTKPQPSQDVRGGRAMREDITRTQRQLAAYNQAKDLADSINLYGEGINKGWGTQVDSNPQKYRKQLNDMVDRGYMQQSNVYAAEAQNFVLEGDVESAQEQFTNLQRTNPVFENKTFEQFQEAVRRRNNLGE